MNLPHPAEDLPAFAQPPVEQVSFALLLDPVPLLSVHMGMLWTEQLREKYSDVTDRPMVLNQLEQFSGEIMTPQFQVEVLPGTPAPQSVFRAPATGVSLAIQADRVTHGWTRPQPDSAYPRYPFLRDSFEHDVAAYASFCSEHRVGSLGLRQVEVTYVNVLASGEGWERPGELHRVLEPWSPAFSPALGEPEDVRIAQRHLALRGGEPYARLHLAIEPHVAPDATTIRLALTFRGLPPEFSLPGIMAFLDDGHERIVRAFAAATTDVMHRVWGRER